MQPVCCVLSADLGQRWHKSGAWGTLFISAFSVHTAVFFSLQSLCLTRTGKPTGVAVSHCITWFKTQLILTTPPPLLYKLRPCPSYSRRRDCINLVPNLIWYKCSAAI